ncbi:MAG: phosphoribosylformylglycinamidine cyclo-ligase, partial [Chloroflexota bacterium]
MSLLYREAGVDLNAAEEMAARITNRLGSKLFAGFLPVSAIKSYDHPVLVSSIDGVGSKARLACRLDRLNGLGQDLVHHCVNDIAVHGATPLLLLDYLAFHHLDPTIAETLVESIARACERLGMTLAGGETAEMPTVLAPGELDIAGAIVGVAEQVQIVDGSAIREGDLLLGLPSSGPHTNGFSLIQHVLPEGAYAEELMPGFTVADALLE